MLDVITFVVSPFMENTYLVADRAAGEAVLIDPGGEESAIIATLERERLRATAIINTHAHPDHVGGAAALQRRLGVPFRLHPADEFLLEGLSQICEALGIAAIEAPSVDEPLRPDETIAIGRERLTVVETPGHSPGSVSFVGSGLLFSGDALFQGSIGRTDLPGGSLPVLLRSIREKLLVLPDETPVYSGHGEPTTVGVERATNPFLTGTFDPRP